MGFFDKFGRKKPGDKPAPKPKAEEKKAVEATDDAKPEAKKEEKKPAKKAPRGPLAKEHAGFAYRVLGRPVFTEKASMLESEGKYTFIVASDANKMAVAEAVRDLYGVKPVSVRIVKVKGKFVRFGRSAGHEKNEKKAVVTLKKGETITLLEG